MSKTEASLARHTTSLPLLQEKLKSLTTSHAESRARKETEIAALKSSVSQQQDIITEGEQGVAKGGKRIEVLQARVEEVLNLYEASESTARTTLQAVQYLLSSRANVTPQALDSLQQDYHIQALKIIKLEKQLSSTQSQLQALVSYSTQQEDSNRSLSGNLKDCERIISYLLSEREWNRLQYVNGKDMRQRSRSDTREIQHLGTELKTQQVFIQLGEELSTMYSQEYDNLLQATREETVRNKGHVEMVEEELDIVYEEKERLQNTLTTSLAHQTALQSSMTTLESINVEMEQTLGEKRGEIEKSEKERERLDRERVRLTSLLNQSRAAQTGLEDELALYVLPS